VYQQIRPFKQDIEVQIIKQSEGDVRRVPELVTEAVSGAFNKRVCRGLNGEFMCEFIPEGLAQEVIDLVNRYDAGEDVDEDWGEEIPSSDGEGSVHASTDEKEDIEDWRRKLFELTGEQDSEVGQRAAVRSRSGTGQSNDKPLEAGPPVGRQIELLCTCGKRYSTKNVGFVEPM
jgi:hypothetical protein